MVRVTVDEAELLVNQLRKIEGGQISDEVDLYPLCNSQTRPFQN